MLDGVQQGGRVTDGAGYGVRFDVGECGTTDEIGGELRGNEINVRLERSCLRGRVWRAFRLGDFQ
jgi:hypothetical protein